MEAGSAQHNALLEDYSSMILALLSLYQSDPDVKWYIAAEQLANEMLEHFSDPQGGFFDTRDDHDDLLVRPKISKIMPCLAQFNGCHGVTTTLQLYGS